MNPNQQIALTTPFCSFYATITLKGRIVSYRLKQFADYSKDFNIPQR